MESAQENSNQCKIKKKKKKFNPNLSEGRKTNVVDKAL